MTEHRSTVAPPPPAADDEKALVEFLGAVETGGPAIAASDVARVTASLGHSVKSVRRRAAGALAACIADGSIGAERVEDLLASEDDEVRWGAAYALGRAGRVDAAVLDAAFAAFASADADVRWAAASLVIPQARSSQPLVARLRDLARSGPPGVRKMALFCLGESGCADADVYVEAFADAEPLVRVAAMTALARSGHRPAAALEALSRVAGQDAEASVRRAAVAILARLQPQPVPR